MEVLKLQFVTLTLLMIPVKDMSDIAAFKNACKKKYVTTDLWAWCFGKCPWSFIPPVL